MQEFNVKLFNITEEESICVINIDKIDKNLRKAIDENITYIWDGENGKIEIAKKEILKFLNNKNSDEKKYGAIAEFFIHFYLKLNGYQQASLFQNLEENSYKKGFDGYYIKDDEEWIIESKSTILEKDIEHDEKLKEAYDDINKKISGKESNDPWKNAYNHARLFDIKKSIKINLKALSAEFIDGKYHKIEEFNIIPCSTIFIKDNTNIKDTEEVVSKVSKKVKNFKYKKIIAICINNLVKELFIQYLEEV